MIPFPLHLVSVIAEDEAIKAILDEQEIPCQTQAEVNPIRILPAKCLSRIYNKLGKTLSALHLATFAASVVCERSESTQQQ